MWGLLEVLTLAQTGIMEKRTKIEGRHAEIVPFLATTGVLVDSQQWSRPSSLATGEVPRAKLLDLNGKIN